MNKTKKPTTETTADGGARSELSGLFARLRLIEIDHEPDGWPAVQMRDITRILNALEFYRRRCDLLQREQQRMRDPERTLVCDALANGHLLQDPDGSRYGHQTL